MGHSARLVVTLIALVTSAGCVLPRPIERPSASEPAAPSGAAPHPSTPTPWLAIGRSIGGRELRMRRVGRGRRIVLWIGCIHGNEREGSVATAELAGEVSRHDDLLRDLTLVMIDDVNPDGSATGSRYNSTGVDLNRNFPARNYRPTRRTGTRPLDQPEARVLHDLILELSPTLIVVAHSTARGGPYINYDGPARRVASAFSRVSGYRVVPSTSMHATPGSLGSWAGIDMQIPILTIEYRRGEDPAVAWQQTREALLEVIRGGGNTAPRPRT